jgi:hypothetical protein
MWSIVAQLALLMSVEVMLRGGSMQGQWIKLQQAGRGWRIVSAGVWMA